MKFHRLLSMSLAAASLAACGGGGNDAVPFTQAQGLSLKATPYLNLMPGIAESSTPCSSLIIPFTVSSAKGAVPAALQAGKIVLSELASGKILWSGPTSESMLVTPDAEDQAAPGGAVLKGVARGCPTGETVPDKEVMVTVELNLGREQASLSTTARISATY